MTGVVAGATTATLALEVTFTPALLVTVRV